LAESAILKDVIRAMRSQGITVLLVEHNLPVVFDLADIVTVLDQGLVIATGKPEEVSADPNVARVYLGRAGRDSVTASVLVEEAVHD
jgi:ABC-type branched-subunit amino acid transport system ATPase component